MADEDNSVMYTAVYGDVSAALADLDAVERLHRDEVIGKYDAAVIDKEDGKPHIVARLDRPGYRVIPEAFGAGKLPRKELHEAAEELQGNEAALIVVGESTLDRGVEKALTKAVKSVRHSFDSRADDLTEEIREAFRS